MSSNDKVRVGGGRFDVYRNKTFGEKLVEFIQGAIGFVVIVGLLVAIFGN